MLRRSFVKALAALPVSLLGLTPKEVENSEQPLKVVDKVDWTAGIDNSDSDKFKIRCNVRNVRLSEEIMEQFKKHGTCDIVWVPSVNVNFGQIVAK